MLYDVYKQEKKSPPPIAWFRLGQRCIVNLAFGIAYHNWDSKSELK